VDGPIVVGVDGSPESTIAASLGHRLAEALELALLMVTAVEDVLLDVAGARLGLEMEPVHTAMIDRARGEVLDALRGSLPSSALDRGVLARLGRPETVLTEVAEETAASLVLLGGRETEGLGRFRRGTAHHLLRAASVPVLVVDPSVAVNGIRGLLVALDTSGVAEPTWAQAERISRALDVPARVLHVVDDRPLSSAFTLNLSMEELAEAQEKAARSYLTDLIGPAVPLEIRTGTPRRVISDAARQEPGTLLVMGSHGLGMVSRWLLGSVTLSLLKDLACSLLVVPPSGPPETP
jgi:nucleotide-binding universal stress UspA family protein